MTAVRGDGRIRWARMPGRPCGRHRLRRWEVGSRSAAPAGGAPPGRSRRGPGAAVRVPSPLRPSAPPARAARTDTRRRGRRRSRRHCRVRRPFHRARSPTDAGGARRNRPPHPPAHDSRPSHAAAPTRRRHRARAPPTCARRRTRRPRRWRSASRRAEVAGARAAGAPAYGTTSAPTPAQPAWRAPGHRPASTMATDSSPTSGKRP